MLNFAPFLQLVVTLVVVTDDEPILKYYIKRIYYKNYSLHANLFYSLTD